MKFWARYRHIPVKCWKFYESRYRPVLGLYPQSITSSNGGRRDLACLDVDLVDSLDYTLGKTMYSFWSACVLLFIPFVTTRVCGLDKAFGRVCLSVLVSLSVCLSVLVCLSPVHAAFESVNLQTSFLLCGYIFTMSRPLSYIKVIHRDQKPGCTNAYFGLRWIVFSSLNCLKE